MFDSGLSHFQSQTRMDLKCYKASKMSCFKYFFEIQLSCLQNKNSIRLDLPDAVVPPASGNRITCFKAN
jgi:hypothetical protein